MILVTGASGFVGSRLIKDIKDALPCPSLRGLGEDDIKRIIYENEITAIVHTAAISDIGQCEKNPDDSYLANVMLPVNIAKASKGIKLVCFSSDQVYSGFGNEGPFKEDTVKPANIYATHKLEMENRVLDIDPDAVMLRAEWMYDYYLKKSNYFMGILNANEPLQYSSTQYRGITYVKEVSDNIKNVIKLPGGSYNFGSETTKSMYEITKEFLKLINKDLEVCDCSSSQNLWVNCEKARRHGVIFSSVYDGLKKCASDYGLI